MEATFPTCAPIKINKFVAFKYFEDVKAEKTAEIWS